MTDKEPEVRGIMATAQNRKTGVIFGLNKNPKSNNYNDIDFGFYTVNNGRVDIYEKGRAVKSNVGQYYGGDTFTILIDDGAVKYFQNGRLKYTSKAPPSFPLFSGMNIYDKNGEFGSLKWIKDP